MRSRTTYRGLLTDFDGTIHAQNQVVSPSVITALRRVQDHGIPYGVCTGRQFSFVQPFLQENGFDGVHIVCAGAQLIHSNGSVIRERVIPADTMQAIADFVNSTGGYLVLKQTYATYANETALNANDKHSTLAMRPLSEIVNWDTPSFYVGQVGDDIWTALESRTDINLLKQRYRSGKPGYFADGVAPDVSKGSGTEWWFEYHNLDPAAVIGIGDGENDVDLLQSVGLGLAMENGIPELRALADAIIPSIDADGVAWAIQEYFGI